MKFVSSVVDLILAHPRDSRFYPDRQISADCRWTASSLLYHPSEWASLKHTLTDPDLMIYFTRAAQDFRFLISSCLEKDFVPMIDSLYHKKPLVLGCLCLFWSVTLIETLPDSTLIHTAIESRIDPILIPSGLWQGKWDLFAPNMDYMNTRMDATITWEDGTQTFWSVPNWLEYSNWQRFVEFRRLEYFDTIHSVPDDSAWNGFAKYLVQQESKKTNKNVRMVEFFADGDFIKKPTISWRPAYSAPLFTERSQFHTWYPHESTDAQSMYFGN